MVESQKMLAGFQRNTILQKSLFVTGVVLALVCSLLALNGRLILNFITISTDHLTPIAVAQKTSGDVRRKLVDDILWLPSREDSQLFLGDSIYCAPGCKVEIVFDKDHIVKVEENSLVKIGTHLGKPLIEIITGDVQVDYKDEEVAYIKQSGQVKEQPVEQAQPKSEEKKAAAKPQKMEPTPPDKIKLYPDDKTVFLHFGVGTVTLSSGDPCASPCEISVKSGASTKELKFEAGKVATFPINVKSGFNNAYTWTFIEGDKKFERSFEILDYNKKNFDDTLKKKSPVVLLTE